MSPDHGRGLMSEPEVVNEDDEECKRMHKANSGSRLNLADFLNGCVLAHSSSPLPAASSSLSPVNEGPALSSPW